MRKQLEELEARISRSPLRGELSHKAQTLKEDYDRLCTYALDGVEDPERPGILQDIASGVQVLNDRMEREEKLKDGATLYFSTLRYRLKDAPQLSQVINDYLSAIDQLNLAELSQSSRKVRLELLRRSEELEKQAFNALWTAFPLSHNDVEAISTAFSSGEVPDYFKQLMTSALFLGQLEYWDDARMALLMNLYDSDTSSEPLQIRALIGLLLSLWMHREHPMSRKLRDRWTLLSESKHWESDVSMAMLQFIRTRETERVTRKMREDVMPDLDRFGRDLARNADGTPDWTNPEWQETLESSGIADKLREMQEMQEDGVDVMMSLFKRLKSMSFFNELSNWFLPFHTTHSSVIDMQQIPGFSCLGDMLKHVPLFCDTDRYASLEGLNMMPEESRQAFLGQLCANGGGTDSFTELHSREQIANAHVRDLNRFFTQFRRNGEFKNPFAQPVHLQKLSLLMPVLGKGETLRLIAEFYFQREYYEDARQLFSILPEVEAHTKAELYEKLGYCCEQTGGMAAALNHYKLAEMLGSQSRWLKKRLANAYRSQQMPEQAIKIYEELSESAPGDGDASMEMNIGHCYLAMKNYDKALNHYYKAEFLLPDHPERTLRPIAWASMLSGDFQQAKKYYDKITADQEAATATDLLNAGHLEMVMGNYRQAILLYRCSRAKDKDWPKAFQEDQALLTQLGVPVEMVEIITDNL